MTIPDFPLPLSDEDVSALILIYGESHSTFTEGEIKAFVNHYIETRAYMVMFEMAANGELKTGYDENEEIVFIKVKGGVA